MADKPVNRMKRFTQNARRVLSYAQQEAEFLQSSSIGTEHILVGLIREEQGLAGKVLREAGAHTDQVQKLVEQIARSPTPRMSSAPLDLSPHVKRMLELAVNESSRADQPMVDTAALLLGLLRLSEAQAMSVLRHLQVDPELVRQRIQQELDAGAGDSPA